MRTFHKFLSLTFLLCLSSGLAMAKVYKVDEYNSSKLHSRLSGGRLDCSEIYVWNHANCSDLDGTLEDTTLCHRATAGRSCACPAGYTKFSSNVSWQGDTTHFNFGTNSPVKEFIDSKGNKHYCIAKPIGCDDNDYVMSDVVRSYTNNQHTPSYVDDADGESDAFSINLPVTNYKLNTQRQVYHIQRHNGGENFYCVPKNASAYSVDNSSAPATLNLDANSNHLDIYLSSPSAGNSHARVGSTSVGGLLSNIEYYYYDGCSNGYSLGHTNSTCPAGSTQQTGDTFNYLINGSIMNGYCYKCSGCANNVIGSGSSAQFIGEFNEAEAASYDGIFTADGDCHISCDASNDYVKIYVGAVNGSYTSELNNNTCRGNTTENGVACGNNSKYVYKYKTLVRNSSAGSGGDIILVCAKPIGCNINAGYIGSCQTNCWKSFFSTQVDVATDSDTSEDEVPNSGRRR